MTPSHGFIDLSLSGQISDRRAQLIADGSREDQAVAAAHSIETTIGGWRQPSMI
jgi:hypothetical protein